MSPKAFGLDVPEQIAEGWEKISHVVVAEVRADGSIDFKLMQESGALRYLATAGASDEPGVIPAPVEFKGITSDVRQVLETNEPIVRRATRGQGGFFLSVFPLRGKTDRVVAVLEPAVPSE